MPEQAKFQHAAGTQFRLQAFLLIRDSQRRILTVQTTDWPGKWAIPGESLLMNEDPADAAARVARLWFETPLKPRFHGFFNYPATGAFDDRWYLLFIFEAEAPANLKGTPDTVEMKWVKPGESPGTFAMSHKDVWDRIKE